MSQFTVFGGRGFIGSEFVEQLQKEGHSVYVPERDDPDIYKRDLGIIIYSAGYGDCNKDPFNVLSANVTLLANILKNARFDKLVYISSTRVYMNQENSFELCDLSICNNDNRRLFNLTKLVSEELCIKSNRNCIIVRPSNVYGLALNSNLFLPSIIRNAINNNHIDMYVEKQYAKDYIAVSDVVDATLKLLRKKSTPSIINIASGINTTAEEIGDILKAKTGCEIYWHNNNSNDIEKFPITDISLIHKEIEFIPRNVLNDLELLIEKYKKKR